MFFSTLWYPIVHGYLFKMAKILCKNCPPTGNLDSYCYNCKKCSKCCIQNNFCEFCPGCGYVFFGSSLCKKCGDCTRCCEKTKMLNDDLCDEEDIRRMEKMKRMIERQAREEANTRKSAEIDALIKARGYRTLGECTCTECHGQTWIYVPYATENDKSTYICGVFNNEIIAIRLGYYNGERA